MSKFLKASRIFFNSGVRKGICLAKRRFNPAKPARRSAVDVEEMARITETVLGSFQFRIFFYGGQLSEAVWENIDKSVWAMFLCRRLSKV